MSIPVSAIQVLYANEYLSAFSLALTVWDHAITLDSEALYIWPQSSLPFVTKAAYISNRYISDAMFGFAAYYLSGTNLVSVLSCRIFIWIFILINCTIISITQSIVAWEIFNLWERRKTVAHLLVILSVVYVPILFITTIECARTALKFLLVSPGSKFCGFSSFKSPWLAIAFGLLTGADLVIVVLVILNAMARPRRANHGLVFALHRDGAAMYTVVLVTRIVALIITIIYDTSTSFIMLPPITAISTTVNCRLMIRVAKLQASAVHSHWVST